MKTMNKILLYDDYCPLCTWYSGLFVKTGLLQPANRVPFSKADLNILTAIDIEKAKDEIPLYDPDTSKTLYGLDSLLEILGQRCPFIKSAGTIAPVNWFFKKLYKFVSYNRKVIVAKKCGPGTFDCSPGFNIFYRILFILFFLLFNTVMLLPLHEHLFSHLSFYHLTNEQLQAGHFAFVGVNFFIAAGMNKKIAIDYLGQVTVLAIITIVLLSMLLFVSSIFTVPEWIVFLYLVLSTMLIAKEYFRRMKYAGILNFYKIITVINIMSVALFLVYVFY